MSTKKPFKGEKLLETLKTKDVYYYIDEEKTPSIKVKSREVFRGRKKEIHYPFSG